MCESDAARENYGFSELNTTMFVINNLFGVLNFVMIFLVPIVTMRLFAEEKREGMFELICAQPLRDWDNPAGQVPGRSGDDSFHRAAHAGLSHRNRVCGRLGLERDRVEGCIELLSRPGYALGGLCGLWRFRFVHDGKSKSSPP